MRHNWKCIVPSVHILRLSLAPPLSASLPRPQDIRWGMGRAGKTLCRYRSVCSSLSSLISCRLFSVYQWHVADSQEEEACGIKIEGFNFAVKSQDSNCCQSSDEFVFVCAKWRDRVIMLFCILLYSLHCYSGSRSHAQCTPHAVQRLVSKDGNETSEILCCVDSVLFRRWNTTLRCKVVFRMQLPGAEKSVRTIREPEYTGLKGVTIDFY